MTLDNLTCQGCGQRSAVPEHTAMRYICMLCGWSVTQQEILDGRGGQRFIGPRQSSGLHPLTQLDVALRALGNDDVAHRI